MEIPIDNFIEIQFHKNNQQPSKCNLLNLKPIVYDNKWGARTSDSTALCR